MNISETIPIAPITPCLQRAILSAYKQDDISDVATLEIIEGHLNQCASCTYHFDQLPEEGLLEQFLKDSTPSTNCDATEVTQTNDISELPLSVLECGNWNWLGQLGRGGSGEVYLCQNVSSRSLEAVKVVRAPADVAVGTIDRVCREARLTQLPTHPNVVRMQSPVRVGSFVLLPMQLILGENLEQITRRLGGKVSVEVACHWIDQVVEALIYAAQQGVVHRDIKPANLMLGYDGVVRLLDFGMAKLTPLDELGENTVTFVGKCGTPGYLAPEQALSLKSADARSDLYSLGCTFYRLLVGHPPFAAETGHTNFDAVLDAHQSEIPRPLHEVCPDIPVRLSALVARLLAKSPADRFASAVELQKALKNWREILTPPHAGPSPKAGPQIPPRNRVSTLVALAMVIVALLVASGAILSIQTKAGEVILQTDSPLVKITIDDRPVKATKIGVSEDGLEKLKITARKGKHQLKIEKDGVSVWSQEVDIGADNQRQFTIRLKPEPAPEQLSTDETPPIVEAPQMPSEPEPPQELTLEEKKEDLRKHLVAHDWRYRDSLYPPGDIARFRPNGKFHDRWNWNYWILDDRSFHVQFWDPIYNPETAVLFEFNEDRTEFRSEFGKVGEWHVVTGRMIPRDDAP
ncbi:serine/threonine-protein kinase [Bremerella sp. JC817]|uniref:serine/threonine protein kinase n=1 Tax=Bremerella sp. JC817 TaxID=3231756 RepID=UPI0034588335